MLKHLFTIPTILCLAAIGTPLAKADMMFAGLDMDVLLHPISATEVQVTVTLSGGATAFVNTGNGTNHPGFAFNLGGLLSPSQILSTSRIWGHSTSAPFARVDRILVPSAIISTMLVTARVQKMLERSHLTSGERLESHPRTS